jgi:hypothetical protein
MYLPHDQASEDPTGGAAKEAAIVAFPTPDDMLLSPRRAKRAPNERLDAARRPAIYRSS